MGRATLSSHMVVLTMSKYSRIKNLGMSAEAALSFSHHRSLIWARRIKIDVVCAFCFKKGWSNKFLLVCVVPLLLHYRTYYRAIKRTVKREFCEQSLLFSIRSQSSPSIHLSHKWQYSVEQEVKTDINMSFLDLISCNELRPFSPCLWPL